MTRKRIKIKKMWLAADGKEKAKPNGELFNSKPIKSS